MTVNKDISETKVTSGAQFKKTGDASSKWVEAENARTDIRQTFGFVPAFMENYTDQSLPGAWAEAKVIRFGTNTALDTKLKALIAEGVAAQIPCDRISYFEEKAAIADGATQQELLEAVLMSAISRRWSTVLNGAQLDKAEFRKEADKVIANVKKMMEDTRDNPPSEEMFLVKPTTPEETYKDIEKTLGLIPKFFLLFPKEGIAGAWSEFKGLQLNPYTALNGKQKELIGLGVSAQIPCEYCIYFHRAAATLHGATDREINEAVAVAACARHWSTVFHGPHTDFASFKKDADQMLQNSSRQRLQS